MIVSLLFQRSGDAFSGSILSKPAFQVIHKHHQVLPLVFPKKKVDFFHDFFVRHVLGLCILTLDREVQTKNMGVHSNSF
jgi:hypothetical protein